MRGDMLKKHQEVVMERDELADDRIAFMAGEVDAWCSS
jgi:hypothetical protein